MAGEQERVREVIDHWSVWDFVMAKYKLILVFIYLSNKIKENIFPRVVVTYIYRTCVHLERDIHVSYCIQIFSREMNKFDSYLATRGGSDCPSQSVVQPVVEPSWPHRIKGQYFVKIIQHFWGFNSLQYPAGYFLFHFTDSLDVSQGRFCLWIQA